MKKLKEAQKPPLERFRARPSSTGRVSLATIDPGDTEGLKRSKAEKHFLGPWSLELAGLQDRLWAQHSTSLLIILQGLDTSGKDGTVKHVMGDMNVQGVRVVSFKQPTAEELKHDFLWRVRKQLPAPGEIVVFNRSHYEDVLVTRAKGLVPLPEIDKRYDLINAFEAEVAKQGTTVVKFMLHISPEEQRDRLLARLDDPNKRWKFSPNDLKERTRWNLYMEAYEIALTQCNPDSAPWFVIPGDHKWFRNWVVSALLVEIMRAMKPAYPQPRLNTREIKAQLRSG
ncbi:MAG: polyphosphate--nucleotide phosphotransferase [Candidatus Dormibacteria bacterium]